MAAMMGGLGAVVGLLLHPLVPGFPLPLALAAGGVVLGLLSGMAFGLFMRLFISNAAKKFRGNAPLLPGEQLVYEGPANHFLNGEAVGGWLYLTSSRLLFRSHSTNLHPHEADYPLSEISSVSRVLTLGTVPNGLEVCTHSGIAERFVVNDPQGWLDKLQLETPDTA